jgi:hypothetical protein
MQVPENETEYPLEKQGATVGLDSIQQFPWQREIAGEVWCAEARQP